jgi:GPI inositol-deacylase
MPFGTALSLFSRQTLLPLLGLLTLLCIIQSILLGTHLSSTSAALSSASQHDLPGGAHTSLPPSWIADMLLGNQSSFFAGTAAFVLFTMVAAVVVEYLVLQALVGGMASGVRWAHAKGPMWVKSAMP